MTEDETIPLPGRAGEEISARLATDILAATVLPVFLITAFPEHLLTADPPQPAFPVTKPFNENMVKTLIRQAPFFNEVAAASTRTRTN